MWYHTFKNFAEPLEKLNDIDDTPANSDKAEDIIVSGEIVGTGEEEMI